MCTVLFSFRRARVRLGFRERAGEFVRIPPGDGRLAMCDSDALVCSSAVCGSW